MLGLTIRAFREADRPVLRQIYLLGRRHMLQDRSGVDLRAEDFDQSVRGEEIWVAEAKGAPVGFISLWVADSFIHNLFVHSQWQGAGIGTALLGKALDRAGRPVTLKCLVENSEAVGFYHSRGWRIDATDTGSQGDCYVMRIS